MKKQEKYDAGKSKKKTKEYTGKLEREKNYIS